MTDLLDEPDADGHTRIRNEETAPIVERINALMQKAMATETVRRFVEQNGMEPFVTGPAAVPPPGGVSVARHTRPGQSRRRVNSPAEVRRMSPDRAQPDRRRAPTRPAPATCRPGSA